MKMLEHVVLSEEMTRKKAAKKLLTKAEKIKYVTDWKAKNKKMLIEGGVWPPRGGDQVVLNPLKFLSGIFFAPSNAQRTVPHLQTVFQADACHMNFGKYTLYSCYGTTANGNTSPVAFGILFGNEDKEGWVQFWKFAKNILPCLDNERNTFITDQAKGLIESIKEVLPNAGPFHCSYHRRQNITKYVRGGNVKYSALWLFNKLVKARSKREIENIKHMHAPYMDIKALKYLNTLPDDQQYPGARCDRDNGDTQVYMYMHEASSAVESMNKANKPARAKTAVDVVCSTHLLVEMCSIRYQAKKEEAWKWEDILTPKGIKLRDEAFEKINYRHYRINIEEGEEKWICRVIRIGMGNVERTCFFLKELEQDSAFGGCSCGLPYTDGVPCHHMVAVVKSSRIEGLTASNAMPYWWSTECWRNQFPVDTNVTCNFDMEAIRATPEDRTMRYCPPYAAARKTGRPKIDKRMKSPMEGKSKRKRGEVNKGKMGGKRRSAD
jgi:hypothetical protein